MPTINLEVPSAGQNVAAGLHAANYADLQALLNGGLDGSNLDPTYAATLGASPLVPVTSLPGSPTDGQQALLVDSLTAPTYAWLFVYRSGISDAYKWIFIGGSILQAAAGNQSQGVGATQGDIAGGPSITLPRAGIYDFEYGSGINISTAGSGNVYLVVNGVTIGDTIYDLLNGHVWNIQRHTATAAGHVAKLQFANSANTSASFSARRIAARPVRVA